MRLSMGRRILRATEFIMKCCFYFCQIDEEVDATCFAVGNFYFKIRLVMEVEYEATFAKVDKNKIRQRLEKLGAKLVKPEFLQTRVVFHLPKGHEIKDGWLRIRDERDKITMTLKVVGGDRIENQKETCLKVDNFGEAIKFLNAIGCRQKAYQESRRETWQIDGVEVTIDEWPFLEPFVEIEGPSEEEVKRISQKLGFDYRKAIFGSVDFLYQKKYGVAREVVNDLTPRIVFDERNPFLK
jgi:adenylate cyclase class 2